MTDPTLRQRLRAVIDEVSMLQAYVVDDEPSDDRGSQLEVESGLAAAHFVLDVVAYTIDAAWPFSEGDERVTPMR